MRPFSLGKLATSVEESTVHQGSVKYIGGYHEYIGGYHEYIGGYHEYIGGYHEYIRVFNINQRLLSTCSPHMNHNIP